jgi:hypothetical protein
VLAVFWPIGFAVARFNKYNAKRTTVDGITFDSKREAARWQELRLLERAGEIRDLKRQQVIPLMGQQGPLRTRTGRPMRLTVDFTYEDKRTGWALAYEDSKGMVTRDYDVRRAVAGGMGIEVEET